MAKRKTRIQEEIAEAVEVEMLAQNPNLPGFLAQKEVTGPERLALLVHIAHLLPPKAQLEAVIAILLSLVPSSAREALMEEAHEMTKVAIPVFNDRLPEGTSGGATILFCVYFLAQVMDRAPGEAAIYKKSIKEMINEYQEEKEKP